MVDTSINFLGKTLKSPIFVGVGPNTQTVEECLRALDNGAGAIEIPFHRGDNNIWDNYRRTDLYEVVPNKKDIYKGNYFGLISTGMNILREEENQEKYIDITTRRLSQVKDGADDRSLVVANIGKVGYMGDGVFSWGHMAKMVEDAGADAITLHLQTGNIMAGGILARDPEFLKRIVSDVRENSSLPIIAKLPIEGCDPSLVADMAYGCGVDAVASTGRFIGLIPDIDTRECKLGGHIGYGGSWVLPNTCAWAARMYNNIPERGLIPGGGISSWKDIIKIIMCGGSMVQVCTWPMVKGYSVIRDAIQKIEKWMVSKGYDNLDDIFASVAKEAVPSSELWARKLKREDAPMYGIKIHEEECTQCLRCLTNCYFDAIENTDEKLRIDPQKCVGCGCCYGTCQFKAIY